MLSNLRIKDLNNNENPRERLIYKGSGALADCELLAIVLRSGGKDSSVLLLAQQLLSRFGGLKGLIDTNIDQLTSFKNIGKTKATCIKACCELALRLSGVTVEHGYKIRTPEDIHKVLRKELFEKTKEYFYLLSLDSRQCLICTDLISVGTVNETLVHPREIYKQAFARNAVSIAIAHNHPSGNPEPSSEDLIITERIAKAGISLGIPLVDHIVIYNDTFVSLKALKLFSQSKGGE